LMFVDHGHSAPSWIRTSGLLLRRESLYPAELSGPRNAHLNPTVIVRIAAWISSRPEAAASKPWQGTTM
jgi:hypothetical protein